MIRRSILATACTLGILVAPFAAIAEGAADSTAQPAAQPAAQPQQAPAMPVPMPMEGPGAMPMGPGQMQGMPMMGRPGGYGPRGRGCGMKHGWKGMGPERMQQHMQAMEERLANIESLLRELVELQKAKQ